MRNGSCLLVSAIFGLLTVAATVAPADGEAAGFGPKLGKCGPLKGAAKAACKQQNRETRAVFNQVKDARFTGALFGGTSIDALFCANGKWKIDVGISGETNTYSGKRWTLTDAEVSSRFLGGLATGPANNIFTRVGLQRRSGKWFFSDGNPALSAPAATRTSAAGECATLQV